MGPGGGAVPGYPRTHGVREKRGVRQPPVRREAVGLDCALIFRYRP